MERRSSGSLPSPMRRAWLTCEAFGCGAGGREGRPRQSANRPKKPPAVRVSGGRNASQAAGEKGLVD